MLNQNNTTMSLIRFNPSYNELLPTFDGFFKQFLDNTLKEEDRFVPNVDIIENDKNFELHVSVPGVKKEDFNIEISDNLLTVSGERKYKSEKKEGNYYSYETKYGQFKRTFRLPKNADQTKIEAAYEAGILTLMIPKSDEQKTKNIIKVK